MGTLVLKPSHKKRDHAEEYFSGLIEKPQSDILAQIKKATPKQEMIKVLVTPAIANDLLIANAENQRKLSEVVVRKYVKLMLDDKWQYNGDTIGISSEGRLLQGQHRLWAIFKSGKSQTYYFACGLHPDSFATMDVGKVRTGADLLSISGYHDAGVLSSSIRNIILFKESGTVSGKIHSNRVNNQDVMDWAHDEKKVRRIIPMIETVKKVFIRQSKFFTPAQWTFLYYILAEKSMEKADFFLNRLVDGQDMSARKNSAIYVLRNQLISMSSGTKAGKFKLNVLDNLILRYKYVMLAWEHFIKNNNVTELRLPKEAQESKIIPKPASVPNSN